MQYINFSETEGHVVKLFSSEKTPHCFLFQVLLFVMCYCVCMGASVIIMLQLLLCHHSQFT